MSEYQYYEFISIDQPLTADQIDELRGISSRARITSTSFTNSYNYGNFRGSPDELMEDYFDLHLYFANWGTKQFSMKFPKGLVDLDRLHTFMVDEEIAAVRQAGDHLILDVVYEPEDAEFDWWDEDDNTILASFSPVRSMVMAGDLDLFYLLWLMAVQAGYVDDDTPEPAAGIKQPSGAMLAIANFFQLDEDLVSAAITQSGPALTPTETEVSAIVESLTEDEKNRWLTQLYHQQPPHLPHLFRHDITQKFLKNTSPDTPALRTAGEILDLAKQALKKREAQEETEQKSRDLELKQLEERQQRARLKILDERGETVWDEVEAEVERTNAQGYKQAMALLLDLHILAQNNETLPQFNTHINGLRDRHHRKRTFMSKLNAAFPEETMI